MEPFRRPTFVLHEMVLKLRRKCTISGNGFRGSGWREARGSGEAYMCTKWRVVGGPPVFLPLMDAPSEAVQWLCP